MKCLSLLTVLCSLIVFSEPLNILVLMPYNGKSHFDTFKEFFDNLGQKGHNVTIVSSSKRNYKSPNVKTVWLGSQEIKSVMTMDWTGGKKAFYSAPIGLSNIMQTVCHEGLNHPNFQTFLKENRSFDVTIAEMFNTECFFGVANLFKTPVIGLSSCTHLAWQAEWFGFPSNPAYIQTAFGGFKVPMSFLSRVENTLVDHYSKLWYKLVMEKQGNELSKRYIGYEAFDPHNASLLLVNTHFTIDGAKPLPPAIVEVGGIHVHNRKPKKLPLDIENWINGAEAGVIYFSLGSMIKSQSFPEKQRKAFVNAFAKFPQRVVWKLDNDSMVDQPKNVLLGKWMPQFDILCNPNVKLFISHGGLLGTIEAVHCGVPIVVMPQFGDQNHNAHALEATGAGVLLHLQTATEESIIDAVNKALDPRTQKNAKLLSERFGDRPMSPMDSAIYWVEYVARHGGAPHMRSPAIDMPFYQLYLIDVYGFLVAIVLGVSYINYVIFRLIWRIMTKNGLKLKTL
ncbi:UDP-glycosyltransferase UGT5-like isoform X2 [Anthonomus grandis grandis]|uniref:UDP-glycosyltransferase UGT5-like isoform X2 n=1 Tax=Anthonomus grandis grandis TaxID=2921223 RepID=UPI002165AADD|nr:UDP-glycosyltransferase UGT5-like isoform X2 [Anthonomus grandis grandis]